MKPAYAPRPQIELHSPGPVHFMRCKENYDWSIVFDGNAWVRQQDSQRYPLPTRPHEARARIHVFVGYAEPGLLPEVVARPLAQLCRELMAGYGAGRPHLHSQRGPLRSPVPVVLRGQDGEWRGCDCTTLAGHVPALLPQDCPPWELPDAFWDALYPG